MVLTLSHNFTELYYDCINLSLFTIGSTWSKSLTNKHQNPWPWGKEIKYLKSLIQDSLQNITLHLASLLDVRHHINFNDFVIQNPSSLIKEFYSFLSPSPTTSLDVFRCYTTYLVQISSVDSDKRLKNCKIINKKHTVTDTVDFLFYVST